MNKRVVVLIAVLVGVMFNLVANDFAAQGKRVAILPFMVKGNFDALYAEVAQDNFTTELTKCNWYQVVMRSQVSKAMKDMKIQNGDSFDEAGAMEIGKLAGAQIAVIGEIIALKSQTVVNIRGINVESGIAEFLERTFLKSENELLVSVENIARKISGLEPKVSSKPQPKTPDFSANEKVATKKVTNKKSKSTRNNLEPTLTESDKVFIRKFYRVKLGINPNKSLTEFHFKQVHIKRIKDEERRYIVNANNLLKIGSAIMVGGALGFSTMAVGLIDTIDLITTCVISGTASGIVMGAGLIVALCCIPYYVYASKIKKTFNYIQNNSLKGSNFTSTGNEKKGFDVALLSCSF